MKNGDIDRELEGLRKRLLDLVDQISAVDRSSLYGSARSAADELTCLMDEAPARRQDEIGYLLDRYDALISSPLD